MKIKILRSIQEDLKQARAGETGFKSYLASLQTHFDRIEADVHAFIPETHRIDRLHEEIKFIFQKTTSRDRSQPLLGLLMGVKDIFHVDGFPTQAGSRLPPERLTDSEAKCIFTLKNLGAIILGKTITTEFAYFAPGPTRNPHHLAHTPGGSSSGSAAAVAAGLVSFAFGSQTIGSIIRPASYCGVVGFKPTFGRISTQGVIPLAPSVDTIGYFTADVHSASFIAPFLVEGWSPKSSHVKSPVLGIPTGPYLRSTQPDMLAHFKDTCLKLQRAGWDVHEVPIMPDFDHIVQHHHCIVSYEAAQVHTTWFQEFGDRYHPKTAELIRRGQGILLSEYQRSLESRDVLRQTLTSIMDSAGIDIWLSPSAQGVAPYGLESTGDPIMNLPWTHCGFPALNLPSGTNPAGLPFGLQITTKWMQDEALLSWASELRKCIHT
jgi:Asp-tRNA(Asn)/Glu-tRNA(Gln) amidotransferase A subunit family amidase